MKTQTLAEFFGVEQVDFRLTDPQHILDRTAHLVVDVQRDFVSRRVWGTSLTEQVAKRIGPLTEQFRKVGVQPYWIYYKEKNLWGRYKKPSRAYGGFYGVKPRKGGSVTGKVHASAFEGSDIDDVLRADGIQNLLISGFNTSMCVKWTAIDALKHDYNVCVLEDMTENGAMPACASVTLYQLEEKGALVAESALVFDYIEKLRTGAQASSLPARSSGRIAGGCNSADPSA